MQQQVNNYELNNNDDEFEGKTPYFLSPSITRTHTVNGRSYVVRSYFTGGKDFNKTVAMLAEKQAYKHAR